MENEPKTPDEKAVDQGQVGHTEHGIPPNATDEEPKGMPDSDRHHSEVAPAKQ